MIMKQFVKNIVIFGLPFFSIFIIYIVTDVYKVIYHYNPYTDPKYYVVVNRAYASTMTYINQKDIYQYDSFILGNSRSMFYEIDTWKQYLPYGSKCIHFDENGGSISGVHDKIIFIDKTGGHINNVLLVIDYDLLSCLEQKTGYLYIAPPILKGYDNFMDFHIQHFKAFLTPGFLYALIDYKIYGEYRPYMETYISRGNSTYIPEYNEFHKTTTEQQIVEGTYYDSERLKIFENVQKPNEHSTEILDSQGIHYLRAMKAVFDKHHTSYKIVISPLYNQVKLNPSTHKILCEIFGKDNIYDFSGVNKWNIDYHNYYENSHYRPIVASEIMNIIYTDRYYKGEWRGNNDSL